MINNSKLGQHRPSFVRLSISNIKGDGFFYMTLLTLGVTSTGLLYVIT